eukprot:1529554-Rhodomonas_salina.3
MQFALCNLVLPLFQQIRVAHLLLGDLFGEVEHRPDLLAFRPEVLVQLLRFRVGVPGRQGLASPWTWL